MFHPQTTLRRIAEKRQNEEGFTLVELMVVVLIIGILIAIAIPVFLNTQNSAKGASAKADAKNVLTEVQSYYAANNAVPNLAELQPSGQQILQGKTIVGSLPATGDAVAYASGTVVARQGTQCFKATYTGASTFFAKGDCTMTALSTGNSW